MFRTITSADRTNSRYGIALLILLTLGPLAGWAQAQSRASLGLERSQLNQQIALTERLLRETMDRSDRSLVELSVINKQIRLRERLLTNLSWEIARSTAEIEQLSDTICTLEADVATLKEDYARTANMTYRAFDTENFWLSVLSAGNLSEAYYRGVYFRQFGKFRERQIQLIRQTQTTLEAQAAALVVKLGENERLLGIERREVRKLQAIREQQNEVYEGFKSKEKSYRTLIEQKRTELKRLIGSMDAAYGARVSLDGSTAGMAFEELKGRLPWPVPVSEGIIVGKFGLTEDPYGNRVENDGVFIRTPQGQVVRAVHSGKVTGVQRIPTSGSVVILEHGSFRTVYANLEYTDLKMGDEVDGQSAIGTVRTDDRTGETLFNFLIYQIPATFIDPETWMKGE